MSPEHADESDEPDTSQGSVPTRRRREPPRFRRVTLAAREELSPRLVRLTLAGGDLDGLRIDEPAASVRVLIPSPGDDELVMPTWTGNEFLRPDGRRPPIRTFTPRRADPDAHELDVWIVVHGGGVASEWAASAPPGAPAAVSGPGRGYAVDADTPAFLLAGDETAIPAVSQLLETLPETARIQVHLEVARPEGRLALPPHPRASLTWWDLPEGATPGDALVDAVRGTDIADDERVWVAGEAAAVQRIRRHLFDDRGLPRARTVVRGYWKRGRAGT